MQPPSRKLFKLHLTISNRWQGEMFFWRILRFLFLPSSTRSCIRIFPPARKENPSLCERAGKIIICECMWVFYERKNCLSEWVSEEKGEGCAIDSCFRLEPIIFSDWLWPRIWNENLQNYEIFFPSFLWPHLRSDEIIFTVWFLHVLFPSATWDARRSPMGEEYDFVPRNMTTRSFTTSSCAAPSVAHANVFKLTIIRWF